jgi:hypothetical protein
MLALVILGLLPVGEIVENIEHWLHDGHGAHSAEHALVAHEEDHGDAGAGHEHGCTPLAHFCGCHTSMAASLPPLGADFRQLSASPRSPTRNPARELAAPWRSEPPPVPPPIA